MTTTVPRIYRPRHVKEHVRLGGKLISCSECVGVMAADAASLGAVQLTQEAFRAMSSEPVPDPVSPGLNLPQVVEVHRKLRIVGTVDRTGDSWGELWAFLNGDRRILLQVQMADLRSCAPGRTGHMILLQAYRRGKGIIVNDPMCDTARWMRPSVVRAAAESFANETHVPGDGLRFAITRRIPRVAVTA